MKKTTDIDPLDRTFSLATLQGKGVRGKYLARISALGYVPANFIGHALQFLLYLFPFNYANISGKSAAGMMTPREFPTFLKRVRMFFSEWVVATML